jgi:hypothetical protein
MKEVKIVKFDGRAVWEEAMFSFIAERGEALREIGSPDVLSDQIVKYDDKYMHDNFREKMGNLCIIWNKVEL